MLKNKFHIRGPIGPWDWITWIILCTNIAQNLLTSSVSVSRFWVLESFAVGRFFRCFKTGEHMQNDKMQKLFRKRQSFCIGRHIFSSTYLYQTLDPWMLSISNLLNVLFIQYIYYVKLFNKLIYIDLYIYIYIYIYRIYQIYWTYWI